MNSFQNRRYNDESSVFDNIHDSYNDWLHYMNNISMRVKKISFIDLNGIRHQYFADTLANLKKTNSYNELLLIKPSIFDFDDTTYIWYDRPFDFTTFDKLTKMFKIVEVLTNEEFIYKYSICDQKIEK